jgi:SAM-dependent methyltransferase
MITSKIIKKMGRGLLRRTGYDLYRISQEERQALDRYEQDLQGQTLATAFGADMPRLNDLKQRYAQVRLPIANHSVWGAKDAVDAKTDIGWGGVDLRAFRGDSAYVWSYANADPRLSRMKYFIYADAVRRNDPMHLLQLLCEDGAFGCASFEYPEIGRVSRDLLDSVIELNFLHKHLGLLTRDDFRVLDVGAGYGRMAHRMLEVNPRIKSYTCVDAVPESTFLCEFYLKHRGVRAEVVPMDELEQKLVPGAYDLALNIHSFSECTYSAIEWWLMSIKRFRVRYLMIIPNDPEQFQSMEADHTRRDYAPLLRELGYTLIAQEPVFADPAVQMLMGVKDNMFLFELQEVMA